jgi:hypothetical protein
MQLHTRNSIERIRHPGLAAVETDLAISGAQTAAWEVFVEAFDAIARAIETVDAEVAIHFANCPTTLPYALEVQVSSLSMRLRAAACSRPSRTASIAL